MRRVLGPEDYARWLAGFLPDIPKNPRHPWLMPAVVIDRADPKLAHTDGLNLSRAWMLEGIARGLPPSDRRIAALRGGCSVASRRRASQYHRRKLRRRSLARHVCRVPHERGGSPMRAVSTASSAATKSSKAVPTLLNSVTADGLRAGRPARHEVRELAAHAARVDRSAPYRADDLSGLAHGAPKGIDEQLAAREGRIVGLAHVGREGPDQIEMLPGSEPRTPHQMLPGIAWRSSRHGPSAPRSPDPPRLRRPSPGRSNEGRQRTRVQRVASPDPDLPNRAHERVAFDQMRSQSPGSHHQQARGLRCAEQACGQRRGRAGTPQRELAAVEQRLRAAPSPRPAAGRLRPPPAGFAAHCPDRWSPI